MPGRPLVERPVPSYLKHLGDLIHALRTEIRNRRKLTAPPDLPGGHRQWIVDSTDWLVAEFGRAVLDRPIVLPAQLIPAGYDGTEAAARAVFAGLCRRMDVGPDQVELRFDLPDAPVVSGSARMYGGWRRGEDRNVIGIRRDLLREPVKLAAVLAHELGHELLIGSGRVERSQPDHEPLTDLLTVFFGLGIFTGNYSYETAQVEGKRFHLGLGYLREDGVADALAYYCFLRKEYPMPDWWRLLDRPVGFRMVTGLGQLEKDRKKQRQSWVTA